MVAKIARHKIGADREKEKAISNIIEKARAAGENLLQAVQHDADAFNDYLDALRLPADTAEKQQIRSDKIQKTLARAIEVPCQTALDCFAAMQAAGEIAALGSFSTITDAAAGCKIAFAGVRISLWNVTVNLKYVTNLEYVKKMSEQCAKLLENSRTLHQENEKMIEARLAGMP